MAEQGSFDINLEDMWQLFEPSGGAPPPALLKLTCNHVDTNRFSWYRSWPIQLDSDLLCELATAPTTNFRLGDFRRYNHTSLTPQVFYNSTPANTFYYGPGTGTTSFAVAMFVERMNLYELSNNDPMYLKMIYYDSSSDRAAETNALGSHTTSSNILSTEDGKGGKDQPPDHRNNQLKSPTTSNILLLDNAWDPTMYTTVVDDIMYLDAFLVNSGGTRIIRLGEAVSDSYKDITVHQRLHPFVDANGPFWTPPPASYTFVALAVTNSSSNGTAVDFTETNGSSTYGTFYWFVFGFRGGGGGGWKRIGDANVTAVLRIPGGTDTTLLSGNLKTAASNSNESASGTLSASQIWAFDDEADVVLTAADWTGFTEYDIGGAP